MGYSFNTDMPVDTDPENENEDSRANWDLSNVLSTSVLNDTHLLSSLNLKRKSIWVNSNLEMHDDDNLLSFDYLSCENMKAKAENSNCKKMLTERKDLINENSKKPQKFDAGRRTNLVQSRTDHNIVPFPHATTASQFVRISMSPEVPEGGILVPIYPYPHGINPSAVAQSVASSTFYPFNLSSISASLQNGFPMALHSTPSIAAPVTDMSPQVKGACPPLVQVNYKKLLDKDIRIDWNAIVDKIVNINDQQASIFLQQKLHNSQPMIKNEIMNTITERCLKISMTRFGNFLLQRCFEHGDEKTIDRIMHEFQGHLLDVSLNPYGCHVIQKALDIVEDKHRSTILQELLPAAGITVSDKYVSHVWQRLLEVCPLEEIRCTILPEFEKQLSGKWYMLALEDTGSLIIQFLLSNCPPESVQFIIMELSKDCSGLCTSRWGNWIITQIVDMKIPSWLIPLKACQMRIMFYLNKNCIPLSFDAFGSRILEKLFKRKNKTFVAYYIEQISQKINKAGKAHILDITMDPHGLYLVQTLIHNCNNEHREKLKNLLKGQQSFFRGSKNGNKCLQLIKQYC